MRIGLLDINNGIFILLVLYCHWKFFLKPSNVGTTTIFNCLRSLQNDVICENSCIVL